MHRLLLLMLMLFAPIQARAIDISAGEHNGFTRIVLNIPSGARWQLVRTGTGYALGVEGNVQPFDLSRAFDRIGRSRIAAMRSESEGRLEIDVSCNCHAMPFEFRPDMLVIDVRDGTAPPGSIFELGLNGAPLLPIAQTSERGDVGDPDPVPEQLDWTKDWLTARQSSPTGTVKEPLRMASPQTLVDLSQLRSALMMEFSRAASDGLVDPVTKPAPSSPSRGSENAESENLRIGETLDARPATREPASLTPSGNACPSSQLLAIETWGDDRAASAQLAEATTSLLGEFDAPDPEAVQRAVRTYLYFSFGAEASQLLSVFPTGQPDEALLRSIARLIDGHADPYGPFPAFAACDGPAAFWSALSDPGHLPPTLDRASVLRTFSTLPPHLRRYLGPTLAETFLAADDLAAATEVVEAVLRHPDPPDDRTTILMARLDLVNGGLATAESRLEAILSNPGPGQSSALIALVDLHAADHRPLDPRVAATLAAYRTEAEGTSESPALDRAHILALALSGEASQAFDEAATHPDVIPQLWNIVAEGPDEPLLLNAIGADPQTADPEDRQRISNRLIALGFLPEAQRWAPSAGPIALPAPPTDRLRTAVLSRNWANLPQDAPNFWADAVVSLRTEEMPASTPLAEASALVDRSQSARQRIDELLRNVPLP